MDRVKTAFAYGADAVYVGLNKHSLRKAEIRFDIPEIIEAIEYAHSLGKRLFVTFNIFAHNEHLADIEKDMAEIAEHNPDAFIMADLGVMNIAKRVAPNVPIHVSTQANTVNIEDVKFWRDFGAKRVVLARELTLPEIKAIHEAVPEVELEAFVHGAMCISYSGRCLLSNYFTGRHANLGECAQPCRWNYRVYSQSSNVIPAKAGIQRKHANESLDSCLHRNDEELFLEEALRPGEYFPIEENTNGTAIMSSRDLRLVRYLPEILEAGVTGLKIEGRNKTSYYVATTASVYSEALSLIEANKYDKKAKSRLEAELEKLNYRDYTTGFIFGDAILGETYPHRSPVRKWDYAGVIMSKVKDPVILRDAQNDNLFEIGVKNKIQKGGQIEVLSPAGVYKETVLAIYDENNTEIDVINPGKLDQKAIIELKNSYPTGSFLRK